MLLFLVFIGCSNNEQHMLIERPAVTVEKKGDSKQQDFTDCKNKLHDGDIVLRTGNDVISGMFAQLNQTNKTYSHCGISFKENDDWVVYHSIGGEDNPDEKLRRDLFEKFVGKNHNLGFSICHYDLAPEQQQKLKEVVADFYNRAIPFDMKFSLQSDDRLYCAEMIYKAFNKALDTTNFFTTTIHKGFEYVSTDNIFVNNKAHILCHIVY